MNPPIQYVKSGNINIAYQVFGSGAIDLVYIPGWVSNIDWMWACPELVRFFQELAKVSRVILFDKRGTGLSDRVVEISTLEERMEDLKAVMDATGSNKAVLFGHSEGGSVSALFSATYPNRVRALIAFGIFAKRRYSDDYPWAPTDEERQKVYDMIENNWGSGDMNLESLAPSKAHDDSFMNWLASYFRSGASPRAAMQLTKMNTAVDITDILSYIKVPTLLMQRKGDIDVKIEEGKFIAQHIKGAKFVELEGDDHLFWAGNINEVLDEMNNFIKELKSNVPTKKGLITVLIGKLGGVATVKIMSILTKHFNEDGLGIILHIDKQHFMVGFDGTRKAMQNALVLSNDLKHMDIEIPLGLYIKEGFLDKTYTVDNEDTYIFDKMLSHATPNSLMVSQTVKHLLSGSSFYFREALSILQHNSNVLCKIYEVTFHSEEENILDYSTYDSFLDDLIKIIHENLDNNSFNIEMLTKSVGMSERQLQRKVKEATGKSPGQLITSIRLSEAKKMLMHHNHTIAEIAFLCGFSSPSYFTKCFKKEFGFTPKDITLPR